MEKLLEKLGEFLDGDLILEGNEDHKRAKNFLSNGILPDGEKWNRKIDPIVGFDGEVVISNILQSESGKKSVFVFDVSLRPGSAGGGGVGIEAAASNQYFNMAGTDAKSIKGMKAAFGEFVKKSTKGIGKQFHAWLKKPENWVWRVVGWGQRNSWSRPSAKIVKIKPAGAMIDPARRKWPSGRTEIWSPIKVTVRAEMKQK